MHSNLMYSKASSYSVFGSWNEVGKNQKKLPKILVNLRKSAYLKCFGNQFKTVYVVSARYAHLEAAYLKALLYITNYLYYNR